MLRYVIFYLFIKGLGLQQFCGHPFQKKKQLDVHDPIICMPQSQWPSLNVVMMVCVERETYMIPDPISVMNCVCSEKHPILTPNSHFTIEKTWLLDRA